ncbi:MAG TPA: penicillin acylase family protein, partial [Blastocatellia bacterium]|nr:penicillin acylase family protein [Blastocatellia bacterium]
MKKRLFVSLLLCSFWLQALSFPHLHAAAQSAAGRTKEAEGERRLAGLSHAVTVWRDERGIPYIEAAGEKDLYFAQGYITAGDRLWQMDMLRRTGRGELAEILGREALGEDKHFRQLGFAALAEQRVGR